MMGKVVDIEFNAIALGSLCNLTLECPKTSTTVIFGVRNDKRSKRASIIDGSSLSDTFTHVQD